MPASAVFPVVAEYKSFTPWGVYLWLELTFTTQTDDASTRSTEAWAVLRTWIIDSPAIRRNGRIHAVRNIEICYLSSLGVCARGDSSHKYTQWHCKVWSCCSLLPRNRPHRQASAVHSMRMSVDILAQRLELPVWRELPLKFRVWTRNIWHFSELSEVSEHHFRLQAHSWAGRVP